MMNNNSELFSGVNQTNMRALHVARRLDLKAFDKASVLGTTPLVVSAGAAGCAVLFRYGVVVLAGLTGAEEAMFLQSIRFCEQEPFGHIESEEVMLLRSEEQNEGTIQQGICLKTFDIPRLQLVADILAKSVVLSHYESVTAQTFDRIEPLAATLQERGRGSQRGRDLLRHIGEALSIQARMVGRAEVTEKPELLWEYPELDRIFLKLEDEYELTERHLALERKLSLISKTAETLLDLLQHKRTHRVEWYIVILIVVEIVITLLEKIF